MNFPQNLVVALTCTDDAALAAWLDARMAADQTYVAARAYWDAANEDEQGKVAYALGWLDGCGPAGVHPAVMGDFDVACERAARLLEVA